MNLLSSEIIFYFMIAIAFAGFYLIGISSLDFYRKRYEKKPELNY